jgi:hypothetical protein
MPKSEAATVADYPMLLHLPDYTSRYIYIQKEGNRNRRKKKSGDLKTAHREMEAAERLFRRGSDDFFLQIQHRPQKRVCRSNGEHKETKVPQRRENQKEENKR